MSRVWYAVDLADGTDPAAQAVMKTANPHESLREIALGRDVSIPPDEFMKWQQMAPKPRTERRFLQEKAGSICKAFNQSGMPKVNSQAESRKIPLS